MATLASCDFHITTAFEGYGLKSELAIMQISTGLPRLRLLAPCMLKAQEVMTRACIDSRMLSTTVVSPC